MIKIILPALITIIGNVIFYILIKKSVDRSIEQYKITYSGIFKEKIDIYREILDKSYKMKILINRYHLTGDQNQEKEIFLNIEEFINYYLKNQPFLSENMLDKLKKIREEFQFIFDHSFQYYALANLDGLTKEMKTTLSKNYFDAGNKFKTDNPFKELENTIISEMRADLKTINFGK